MTPVVDPLRLQTLLDRLTDEVAALRRLGGRPGLEDDDDLVAAVKYRFIVAIETAIAIGRHVLASEGLRAARDYADVFGVLTEAGIVPPDLARDLRDMARFRNLLVHEYAQVDDGRVVTILRERLGDLDRFRTAVAASVDERYSDQ